MVNGIVLNYNRYGEFSNSISSNVWLYSNVNQTMGIHRTEEEALNRFKESENVYREYIHKPIHVGNGILDQIKPVEPFTLKVEDLYESLDPIHWGILDRLLEDRVDLHNMIKRYKESRVA